MEHLNKGYRAELHEAFELEGLIASPLDTFRLSASPGLEIVELGCWQGQY